MLNMHQGDSAHACVDAPAQEACDDGDGLGGARRPREGCLDRRQGVLIEHVRVLEDVRRGQAYAEGIVLPCGHPLMRQNSIFWSHKLQLFCPLLPSAR